MGKTNIILCGLIVILLIAFTLTTFQLLRNPNTAPTDSSGAPIVMGLADVDREDDDSQYQARSALLYNIPDQTIKFEQNGFERLPIASLTKIMTAMIAIDNDIDWDRSITILPDEFRPGGQLVMHSGEEATVRDLFHASLLGSANNATLAYVRSIDLPTDEFVQAMNRKAVVIGLEQTHFTEPTGLDPANVSTAYEVALMAAYAFDNYSAIAAATSLPEYTFTFQNSDREHTMRNTNKLISDQEVAFTGSKTGYLYEASYCLVVQGAGEYIDRIAVILGSPSEARHFIDTNRLLKLPVP